MVSPRALSNIPSVAESSFCRLTRSSSHSVSRLKRFRSALEAFISDMSAKSAPGTLYQCLVCSEDGFLLIGDMDDRGKGESNAINVVRGLGAPRTGSIEYLRTYKFFLTYVRLIQLIVVRHVHSFLYTHATPSYRKTAHLHPPCLTNLQARARLTPFSPAFNRFTPQGRGCPLKLPRLALPRLP